jgi:hypothetical protein
MCVSPTVRTRSPIRLNLGGLELYRAPGLEAELRRLRSRYTAGQASVVNPRVGGSHGDIAQALALAVHSQDLRSLPKRATLGRPSGKLPRSGPFVPVMDPTYPGWVAR